MLSSHLHNGQALAYQMKFPTSEITLILLLVLSALFFAVAKATSLFKKIIEYEEAFDFLEQLLESDSVQCLEVATGKYCTLGSPRTKEIATFLHETEYNWYNLSDNDHLILGTKYNRKDKMKNCNVAQKFA